MDAKSAEVLRDLGPKRILADLVNIPSRDYDGRDWPKWMEKREALVEDPEVLARARGFIAKYGVLRDHGNPVEDLLDVLIIGTVFRTAWVAGEDESLIERVNVFLSDIVSYRALRPSAKSDAFRGRTPKPIEHPILQADFSSGEWTMKPRDLADALAKELMQSRKMLHICERSECGRYFVKEFSRDRYCSRRCAEEMRRVGQSTWAKDRRAAEKKSRKKRK